ncbi:hypothetical protein PRUPE_1G468900 [Prunus persica]|uniref:Uncharacterized protein n=1 Tax=Prunus persica TaxID=3760 RepID=A0A251RE22_PRUPE|nr:hypothetical protein PRUPE_1G468900 [Prunus persica]
MLLTLSSWFAKSLYANQIHDGGNAQIKSNAEGNENDTHTWSGHHTLYRSITMISSRRRWCCYSYWRRQRCRSSYRRGRSGRSWC